MYEEKQFVPVKVYGRYQFEELDSPSEAQHRAKMQLCEFATEMRYLDALTPSMPLNEFAIFCEDWERNTGQALRFDEEGGLKIII